jgi:DNA-binding MarR family transcriptional regulator
VFDRKILRRIYGPVQDKDQWRSRYNKELYDLFKKTKLSLTIRIARLRRAGLVRRVDEEALPRRIIHITPIGQGAG